MTFVRHSQVKVANQTQLFMQIAIPKWSQRSFAQAQRQRHQIRKHQPHFQLAAVAFERGAQAQVPTPFDPRQVLMYIHSCQQRYSGGVGNLPT